MYKKAILSLGIISGLCAPMSTITIENSLQNGPQAEIYKLALKYEDLNEQKGRLTFAEMRQNIGSVTHEQLGITGFANDDLNVNLKIVSKNVVKKNVLVMYLISKIGYAEASGFITIYGSDYNGDEDLNDAHIVKEIEKTFKSPQDTKNRDFYPQTWSVAQEITVEQLGIVEPSKNGATITYRIQKINLYGGQVIVEATITKGNISLKKIVEINQFLTSNLHDEKIAQKFFDNIPYEQPTTAKIFPLWKNGDELTGKELALNLLDIDLEQYEEFKVTYVIKDINLKDGVITTDALIKKNGQVVKTKHDVKITDFLKQEQEDEKILKEALDAINDETSTFNDKVPEWEVNSIVTREELGIAPLDFDNVTSQYKIIEKDLEEGHVKLEVTITTSNKSKTKTIIVNGFKSRQKDLQDLVDKVKAIFVNKYQDVYLRDDSNWIEKLPSEAEKALIGNWTVEDLTSLNISVLSDDEKQGTNIEYKIVDFDDDLGQVSVKVIVTKDELSAAHTFLVKGFETSAIRNKKLVEKTYQQIINDNKISESDKIINLDENSVLKKRLPSKARIEVDDTLHSTQLKNLNIILPETISPVEISARVSALNDDNGTMLIVLKITADLSEQELSITVQGFRTKASQDEVDVLNMKEFLQDKYKDVKINETSLDKLKLPSEIKDDLHDDALSLQDLERLNIKFPKAKILGDVKLVYKIKSVNNGSGQIMITINLEQGDASDSFDFTIKGFQSQNERNLIIVEKLMKDFISNNKDKTIDKDNDFSEKTPSEAGYKIGETLTGEKLNNLNLTYTKDDIEVEWDFKVKDIDNDNGEISLEVNVQKGFASKTSMLKVAGFKNNLQ